jgi:hypothetical protein
LHFDNIYLDENATFEDIRNAVSSLKRNQAIAVENDTATQRNQSRAVEYFAYAAITAVATAATIVYLKVNRPDVLLGASQKSVTNNVLSKKNSLHVVNSKNKGDGGNFVTQQR